MPNKGTPQGAIISPLLFNIAMRRLARALDCVPQLGYTLYADDITLWATRGSLASKEQTLQEAALAVENFARTSGLSCAPEKSEVIRIHSKRYKSNGKIEIEIENQKIKEVTVARILGFWVQSNGRANHTIGLLKSATKQVARMIQRITFHKKGMKESDTVRLVQALVMSKLTYSLPFHTLNKSEEGQVDSIIRGAYKAALGLPIGTPTDRLLEIGVHNTYAELKAATLISQRNRLSQTKSGREILIRAGIPPHPQNLDEGLVEIPEPVRRHISVAPIPRNMTKERHKERREERIKWIRKLVRGNENVLYVDASRYNWKRSVVTIVSSDTRCMVSSASLYTSSIAKAECFAIALAIKSRERNVGQAYITIISDSQEACRLFTKGRLPLKIRHLLGDELHNTYRLVWCPGHAGLEGNERADALARALTNRAEHQPPSLLPPPHPTHDALCEEEDNDPARMAPRELLAHQRCARQKYGAPHKSLKGADATDLRRIQTGVYPNLLRLHKIFPILYGCECPWCRDSPPTLYHISWGCSKRPQKLNRLQRTYELENSLEQWEALLASSDPEVQLALLDHVRLAAQASGALDMGPHPSRS
uniref:Putative tick transposon n=1 Tax=Rhipicephalus pulchellus TaxID=72859 RepID=L7M015_RHIPC